MIDFHCHMLPEIDDGSKDLKTSLEILTTSRKQGVDYMIATPHFYAMKNSVDSFLEKRNRAVKQMSEAIGLIRSKGMKFSCPGVFLGSETAFFNGISRAERIEDLTIKGTNILLLEMPFDDWQQSYIREVRDLCERKKLQIILAHLERFMIKPNRKLIKELLEMSGNLPVYVQINAEALDESRSGRKLVKMFADGEAHFLGSDCHGIHRRPPNLIQGRDVLEKKLGEAFMKEFDNNNARFLKEAGLKL